MRNGGSERYSEWIDHTLPIRCIATLEWINEHHYEFHTMDSPETIEEIIKAKVEQAL
ncbi:DNA/RNA helicase domain-containing protein [Pedobacter sp. L105]|uniref:DNA/RNA helicase domain-containing protein n=1 Tax=Pedobacter sp. L105 TaxID=1641871 RepID=UPI00131C7220